MINFFRRLRGSTSLRKHVAPLGINYQTWWNWENGIFKPDLKHVRLLAKLYNLEIKEVLKEIEGGQNNEND